jgi:phosphoheptose isomerase
MVTGACPELALMNLGGIIMPYPSVDLTNVKTYPLVKRENRVALEDLIFPATSYQPFENPELLELAVRVVDARMNGKPVIFMMGGHVIKRGLAPLVIDLLKRGVVTHLASNGAATIHDFEIGFQGHTSEDVLKSLEDGSFGMAEETGRLMNLAIQGGVNEGLGLGEALGRLIAEDPRFVYRENSVLCAAYKLGIPYTVHIAIGTDIIHQHPKVDFAASGWASGQDFKIFARAVCDLQGGVFCNFGSSVIGPEVFLKALSIARNLGNTVKVFTTANFDLIPLGDYRKPVGDDHPDYYYRPRKNIVNRPVALGGRGYHITGDHRDTLPNLYHQVTARLEPIKPVSQNSSAHPAEPVDLLIENPKAAEILETMLGEYPALNPLRADLVQSFIVLKRCFLTGGTLYLAGNGGSMSDALHICGELDKAYKKRRPIPAAHKLQLVPVPGGAELADCLQVGLRSMVLGNNPALASAVENDFSKPYLGFAQELYAVGHAGDVFLGISTSGNAKNILYTIQTARLLNMTTIGLTGQAGGLLAAQADIVLLAPAKETAVVQSWHMHLYHCLCEMLEAQIFSSRQDHE